MHAVADLRRFRFCEKLSSSQKKKLQPALVNISNYYKSNLAILSNTVSGRLVYVAQLREGARSYLLEILAT